MASRKFLVGLLAGVAAGSFVALLCTTEEGKKLRKSVLKSGTDYVDDLKDSFSNYVDSVTGKYIKASNDMLNKARTTWENH